MLWYLADGLPLVCGEAYQEDATGCYSFCPGETTDIRFGPSSEYRGTWLRRGNYTSRSNTDASPLPWVLSKALLLTAWQISNLKHRQSSAYAYQNNSLVMVGGEICKGSVLCNNYTDQTIITNDGGNTFRNLSTFPALLKGACAVFTDETTLMVIGGYKFPL